MATKRVVVTICDMCGTEKGVQQHDVKVDDRAVTLDACRPCWKPARDLHSRLMKVGRPRGKRA